MAPPKNYEVLVLGGHMAGVATAHYVLRHVIAPLRKVTPSTKYHVTIVAPNTEFYSNIPSPRALVPTSSIKPTNLFFPLTEGFTEYDASLYTFVQGKATAVDPASKTVTVKLLDTKADKSFKYDTLVLATGSKASNPLWYVNDSGDAAREAFKESHAALSKAETILVAGGGAIGVETAAEIGYWLKKKVTLLSGGKRLLPRHPAGNSTAAQKQLKGLGVTTVHDLRVESTNKVGGGKTEVVLSDGSKKIVDVYIDATGPTRNSEYVPKAWLNTHGSVEVDPKTFRVVGAPGVYAAGDISSVSDGGVGAIMMGTTALGSSIGIDIAKEVGVKSPVVQKEYKPFAGQFVTIGPKGGVAYVNGWRLPSFMVWAVKSRTMFEEKGIEALKGVGYKKP